jgi:hypothetical protein
VRTSAEKVVKLLAAWDTGSSKKGIAFSGDKATWVSPGVAFLDQKICQKTTIWEFEVVTPSPSNCLCF